VEICAATLESCVTTVRLEESGRISVEHGECVSTLTNSMRPGRPSAHAAREIFIDNLLVRVHFIIKMSRLALRHGSLNSLFQVALSTFLANAGSAER